MGNTIASFVGFQTTPPAEPTSREEYDIETGLASIVGVIDDDKSIATSLQQPLTSSLHTNNSATSINAPDHDVTYYTIGMSVLMA